MLLEINKKYLTKSGIEVVITDGLPPKDNNKREGWNGIYFGKVNGTIERFLFDGKHWDYISAYSPFGYQELNNPELDLIKEIK
jgi:hypothetical protein